MNIQPVRRNHAAKYPTKQRLSERPELLKSMPQRWRTNRAVITLLGSVSLLAAARSIQKQEEPEFVIAGGPMMSPSLSANYRVVQTFEKEAKKAGLHLVIEGRHVPVKKAVGKTTRTKQYLIDFIDPKTGVGFEFVDDRDAWQFYGDLHNKTSVDLAKAIKEGCKHIKNGNRIKVIAGTDESEEKQVRKAKREIKSFFIWLKKQGVI